ncbi:hypothetical protein HDU96_004713 [Phlyctochytrium bullatum]|nr:hypothetical protein HDU96_004713 [Phlyctochytrium bullatum]
MRTANLLRISSGSDDGHSFAIGSAITVQPPPRPSLKRPSEVSLALTKRRREAPCAIANKRAVQISSIIRVKKEVTPPPQSPAELAFIELEPREEVYPSIPSPTFSADRRGSLPDLSVDEDALTELREELQKTQKRLEVEVSAHCKTKQELEKCQQSSLQQLELHKAEMEKRDQAHAALLEEKKRLEERTEVLLQSFSEAVMMLHQLTAAKAAEKTSTPSTPPPASPSEDKAKRDRELMPPPLPKPASPSANRQAQFFTTVVPTPVEAPRTAPAPRLEIEDIVIFKARASLRQNAVSVLRTGQPFITPSALGTLALKTNGSNRARVVFYDAGHTKVLDLDLTSRWTPFLMDNQGKFGRTTTVALKNGEKLCPEAMYFDFGSRDAGAGFFKALIELPRRSAQH